MAVHKTTSNHSFHVRANCLCSTNSLLRRVAGLKVRLQSSCMLSEISSPNLWVRGSAINHQTQMGKLSGGVVLLERYGMTEIGMALSNGYAPEKRLDGSVGWPLPGVTVRLITTDDARRDVTAVDNEPGEIQVKGDNVFLEYWRNPEATKKEFTEDGFFKTGDIAIANQSQSGAFYIQGRASVDIIKSGGYKISALDVERELLSLPVIDDVAVVGLDDEEWGQRVAAVVTLADKNGELKLKDLRNMLRKSLAPYKIPTVLKVIDEIPRNKMGKGMHFTTI